MKMKILLMHNFHQQPGGENQAFANESALLEANGHEVGRFTVYNKSIRGMSVAPARGTWGRPRGWVPRGGRSTSAWGNDAWGGPS